MKKYPPKIQNVNKMVIYSKVSDGEHSGAVTVTRWQKVPLVISFVLAYESPFSYLYVAL